MFVANKNILTEFFIIFFLPADSFTFKWPLEAVRVGSVAGC